MNNSRTYIELSGAYAVALQQLAEKNHEPTITGMVRMLIRDAAREQDLWPPVEPEEEEVMEVA